jgi:prepilin-type N-terminal cleavage/methylation domain-containing protein
MRLSFSVRLRRARTRLVCQRGITLIETLITMLILGIVLSSLTGALVSASHAELNLNQRFQAQAQARLALDRLRRELHCASSLTITSSSMITITLPSYCQTGSGSQQTVMWCVSGSSAPYALYRIAPSTGTCTGGTKLAGSLVAATWFSAPSSPPSTAHLATLHVDLPVNVRQNATASSPNTFDLYDDIALRNSPRS